MRAICKLTTCVSHAGVRGSQETLSMKVPAHRAIVAHYRSIKVPYHVDLLRIGEKRRVILFSILLRSDVPRDNISSVSCLGDDYC